MRWLQNELKSPMGQTTREEAYNEPEYSFRWQPY